jgi:hypothetical protein
MEISYLEIKLANGQSQKIPRGTTAVPIFSLLCLDQEVAIVQYDFSIT